MTKNHQAESITNPLSMKHSQCESLIRLNISTLTALNLRNWLCQNMAVVMCSSNVSYVPCFVYDRHISTPKIIFLCKCDSVYNSVITYLERKYAVNMLENVNHKTRFHFTISCANIGGGAFLMELSE